MWGPVACEYSPAKVNLSLIQGYAATSDTVTKKRKCLEDDIDVLCFDLAYLFSVANLSIII